MKKLNKKEFYKAQIRKERLRLAIAYAIFFSSIVVGSYVAVHLHISQLYPVMDGSKILWGRKLVRYMMYLIPYLPAIWSVNEIHFRESRIKMQERRKRRC